MTNRSELSLSRELFYIVKNGSENPYTGFFSKRGFWIQVLWVLFLCGGVAFGCLISSVSVFVAAVLISFLGLNETNRWSYKTNLILCAAMTIAGAVAGVFSWIEMLSVFLLLFLAGGFMLYYRDTSLKLYPAVLDFSEAITESDRIGDITVNTDAFLKQLLPGSEIFIVLADEDGGLYLPETEEEGRINLKRNGSMVWKTFASGKAFMTNRISVSKDKPLWYDANSAISIPLEIAEHKLGVLQIEAPNTNAYAVEYINKIELFAHILSHRLMAVMPEYRKEEKEAK